MTPFPLTDSTGTVWSDAQPKRTLRPVVRTADLLTEAAAARDYSQRVTDWQNVAIKVVAFVVCVVCVAFIVGRALS